MMFMHDITIYHLDIVNGQDVYTRTYLKGVYWQGSTSASFASKGNDKTNATTIITSPQNAQKYGTEWTMSVGDKIIKGNGKNINSIKELNSYVTVQSVTNNSCGSAVDNVVISCV